MAVSNAEVKDTELPVLASGVARAVRDDSQLLVLATDHLCGAGGALGLHYQEAYPSQQRAWSRTGRMIVGIEVALGSRTSRLSPAPVPVLYAVTGRIERTQSSIGQEFSINRIRERNMFLGEKLTQEARCQAIPQPKWARRRSVFTYLLSYLPKFDI
ncbi:hypothetical protein BDR22DRAFT_823304 [Usnea florida]